MLVTLGALQLPEGCYIKLLVMGYSGKLPGAIIFILVLCFGIQVNKLELKVQNHYNTLHGRGGGGEGGVVLKS